jgi:sterol 24-C-methyltransferase
MFYSELILFSQVNTLEFLRIAPAGSVGAYNVLTSASDGLLKGGR